MAETCISIDGRARFSVGGPKLPNAKEAGVFLTVFGTKEIVCSRLDSDDARHLAAVLFSYANEVDKLNAVDV